VVSVAAGLVGIMVLAGVVLPAAAVIRRRQRANLTAGQGRRPLLARGIPQETETSGTVLKVARAAPGEQRQSARPEPACRPKAILTSAVLAVDIRGEAGVARCVRAGGRPGPPFEPGLDPGLPDGLRCRELKRDIESKVASALDACAAADAAFGCEEHQKTLARYQNVEGRLRMASRAAADLDDFRLIAIINREWETVIGKQEKCRGRMAAG